ncbi:MAG: peptidylprolyl isomerase [Acidovorax sp.]|nr:peptidylprolyl isomerase [Acidovorax sp.]
MTRFSTPLRLVSLAAALAWSASALAAEPGALIQGSKFSITTADIQADALRMPQEMRSIVLAKPQTVTQIASNLYARRSIAQQAEADGLDKDPTIAAALQIARDKVLSDAWMEKMDKANEPKPEAAEAMARAAYKAKPERFKADEQVRARHILVAGTNAESRAKADKILADLKAGGDFTKLAKEHSADKSNADKGGDLGFFGRGQMVPEFESVAFALTKKGDLSGVVESKFGFHIIQLEEKKPAGIRPYDEVKADLVKEISASVKQEARVAHAQKMQQGVTTNAEAIAAFAAKYAAEHPTAPTAPNAGSAQQKPAVK